MQLPSIIQNSASVLSQIVDNVEEIALINVLNAKIAHLVSLKGCTFKQFSNGNPVSLSYYGMNFMNSGANKDYAVDCINNYLLSFVDSEVKQHIEDYKEQYEQEQSLTRVGKKEADKIEDEVNNIRVANLELANPNYTGLYSEAQQIKKIGFGSLFVRIGELGDYLENIVSGNASKKELYQKMKDIYEGTFYPSVIAGDSKRESLKNVPVQIFMYTDFENLKKEKVREYYLTSLKTGMARRSFIYMPLVDYQELRMPLRPKQKEDAIYKARELERQLKGTFDKIPTNKEYILSEEAKDRLYDYQCECIKFFNSNLRENEILKIERKESFWKIMKLAAVYAIISEPTADVISVKYVEMAISFYDAINPCLRRVLEKKADDPIEMCAEYLHNNNNRVVTRMELRKQKFVNGNNFKDWIEKNWGDIVAELFVTFGDTVQLCDGAKNQKNYQIIRGAIDDGELDDL